MATEYVLGGILLPHLFHFFQYGAHSLYTKGLVVRKVLSNSTYYLWRRWSARWNGSIPGGKKYAQLGKIQHHGGYVSPPPDIFVQQCSTFHGSCQVR